ncbi:FtsB family cell division protein [Thermicanus aegyptius]|uniref:FtsB family cell division protein n=1 Tax=Thermicanus aegyptius TaxID=94009 RepID=UPI00146FADE7|nr:septum formation initiator family protein [Thermicanus aegyptius]
MWRKEQGVKRRMRLALFVVGLLLIWALYIGWQQERLIKSQEEVKSSITKELEQKKAEKKDLEYQVERLKDPDYIANLARSKYYMSKEGEVIFEIIPSDGN